VPNVVDLRKADAWIVEVGAAYRKAAILGLYSAALRGVQVIVTQIIPARTPQPVDRAVYRSGWRVSPAQGGADIENLEPHAAFIEDGVRAANVKIGRAMIEALSEWVVRKRIASRDEALSVAWAIAKAMQRRGIFGRRGLGILRELVEQHLDGIVREEVSREVDREMGR
jgi:site-specific recombinase XerC